MAKLRSEPEVIAEVAADQTLAELARCAKGVRCWLVGGSVRDRFLGLEARELDVAVEGELGPLVDALGGAEQLHPRFGTARVELSGAQVDLARTRRERYPQPGALPEVEPAPLRADLARRDFTVNAIAVSLGPDPELVDPYDGRADLAAGLLRVLHRDSISDDPTRAYRAARYAARLGLALDPETAALIAAAEPATVSADRREAELLRLAAEPAAVAALALLADWGVIDAEGFDRGLAECVAELAARAPWAELLDPPGALLAAAIGLPSPAGGADSRSGSAELEGLAPARPSQAVAAARRFAPATLAIARCRGAEWLERWAAEWRHVRLEIGGDDLLEAGIERGPQIGIGLEAALAARLDGEAPDAAAQLEVALAAARAL